MFFDYSIVLFNDWEDIFPEAAAQRLGKMDVGNGDIGRALSLAK
jgi:hypothetical protein